MSDVVLGCDSNTSNDSKVQETIAKMLRKAGHKVEKLPIGPGYFADYSYANKGYNPKGKIGIYLMAGSVFSVADLAYGSTQFKYAYFGIRGDASPSINSWNAFKTKGIKRDSDCTAICDKLAGKTFPQMNPLVKKKCQITFGTTAEELGNNLIKAMGGEAVTDDSGNQVNGTTDEDKEPSATSIKEALQKLLKHWDGEVECYIRDDKVYVHKVRDPVTYASLLLEEGVNVLAGSVHIKDMNPDTTNHLIVEWTDGEIEFKDNDLIKRFGEKEDRVEAVKIVNVKSEEMSNARASAEQEVNADMGAVDSTNVDNLDNEDIGVVDDTGNGTEEGTDTSATAKKSKATAIPIDNYDDALKFGQTYWNKIRRDNGHSLECQVMGSDAWKVGEWCRVKLPSFDEDNYMYITRVSHSGDADWTCNLTLQDYPPGWGVEEEEEVSQETGATGEDAEGSGASNSDIVKKILKEISKFSYSHSCSDGECIKSGKKGDCWALSDYIYNRLTEEGMSAKIYEYKTSGSNQHRQVKFNNGGKWDMFPYSKSGIDHNFYTNEIPSDAKEIK